jgi:branched-chain amino acid transport system ATP-binding protein
MSAVPPALEARELSKSFGGFEAVRGVSLALEPGERRALIGPNGAGKTTFINLLAGRLKADSGSIMMAGMPVTALGEAARARAGLGRTFQINSLFRNLTVFENIYLAVSEHLNAARHIARPALGESQVVRRAERIIAELGLSAAALIQQLPYGEQRLVEIAIALALEPKVLLLDEPAAGVPQGESRLILDLVAALPAEIAVLLIDHDMDVVFRFARRITVLAQGAILADGTPEAIARDPEVRRVYLGRRRNA